jgi:prepilin-type N-terminal cleavage/methylation domain-containing protein
MAARVELRYPRSVLASFDRAHRPARGFSLVELLAVVVISGILAVVGVALFRRYVLASHGTEASSVIQAIRAAEEGYLAENHTYLNVSTGTAWYPRAPTVDRGAWRAPGHQDFAAWMRLAPAVNRSVMYGYLANAGTPGSHMPALQVSNAPDLSQQAQPLDWYLIQASGDVNGNGIFSRYVGTSISGEIYLENEGE